MAAQEEYTRSLLLGNYTLDEIKKLMPTLTSDWAFDSKTTVEELTIEEEGDNKERVSWRNMKIVDGVEIIDGLE